MIRIWILWRIFILRMLFGSRVKRSWVSVCIVVGFVSVGCL